MIAGHGRNFRGCAPAAAAASDRTRGPAPGGHCKFLKSGSIEDRWFLDAYHISNLEGRYDKQLKVIALLRQSIDAAVKKARKVEAE